MPTENADAKAKRMLAEGRLTVTRVTDVAVKATCKGDSGEIYQLGWHPRFKVWVCECEGNRSFNRRCSHIRALQLVATKPKPKGATA